MRRAGNEYHGRTGQDWRDGEAKEDREGLGELSLRTVRGLTNFL
jgi:hypothetical protein